MIRTNNLNDGNVYDLFEKCNWLTTLERMIYSILCFVKNHVHDELSTLYHVFKPFFTHTHERTSQSRRKPNNFEVHLRRTTTGQTTFVDMAIKLWNDLPAKIQNTEISFTAFTCYLSNYYVSRRRNDFI